MLAEHADFHVNINSVVGGGIHNPHDAMAVAKRAVELGFTSTVGIIHDTTGNCSPSPKTSRQVFLQVKDMGKKNYAAPELLSGQHRARQGKQMEMPGRRRYLYVCEDGLVHYCSQQRGYPGIPLEEYTIARHPARILDRKRLRASLHGGLRALHVLYGFLARSANHSSPPPAAIGLRRPERGNRYSCETREDHDSLECHVDDFWHHSAI